MGGIASGTGEQRINVDRVTTSVGQLNQVTRAIAANAGESAAAVKGGAGRRGKLEE